MKIDKYEMYYNLMERWLTIHEEGRTIPQVLETMGFSTIAVYGLGKIGKHVIYEMKGSNVNVQYAIDRVRSGKYDSVIVKNVDEPLPEVDAVIVTTIYDFEEVEEMLVKKVHYPIISLEEILYEG